MGFLSSALVEGILYVATFCSLCSPTRQLTHVRCVASFSAAGRAAAALDDDWLEHDKIKFSVD